MLGNRGSCETLTRWLTVNLLLFTVCLSSIIPLSAQADDWLFYCRYPDSDRTCQCSEITQQSLPKLAEEAGPIARDFCIGIYGTYARATGQHVAFSGGYSKALAKLKKKRKTCTCDKPPLAVEAEPQPQPAASDDLSADLANEFEQEMSDYSFDETPETDDELDIACQRYENCTTQSCTLGQQVCNIRKTFETDASLPGSGTCLDIFSRCKNTIASSASISDKNAIKSCLPMYKACQDYQDDVSAGKITVQALPCRIHEILTSLHRAFGHALPSVEMCNRKKDKLYIKNKSKGGATRG